MRVRVCRVRVRVRARGRARDRDGSRRQLEPGASFLGAMSPSPSGICIACATYVLHRRDVTLTERYMHRLCYICATGRHGKLWPWHDGRASR